MNRAAYQQWREAWEGGYERPGKAVAAEVTKLMEAALADLLRSNTVRFYGTMAAQAAPAPEPDLPERTTTEPVIGWRSWNLGFDDRRQPILRSFNGTPWEGPVLRAEGEPNTGRPDVWRCGAGEIHGIYAWRSLRGVSQESTLSCEGEVELYGKVVVHEHGYRAEAALVRRIVVYPGRMDIVANFDIGVLREVWCGYPNADRPPKSILSLLAARYDCEVEVGTHVDWDNIRGPYESPIICPRCTQYMHNCECEEDEWTSESRERSSGSSPSGLLLGTIQAGNTFTASVIRALANPPLIQTARGS